MVPTTLTNLVKDTGISLNAASICLALKRAGLAQEVQYPSTTGSGEMKSYDALTEMGERFGVNRPTMHEFKTEMRFYPSLFPELMQLVSMQIAKEISTL